MLGAGDLFDPVSADLTHVPVSGTQVIAGSPTTATLALTESSGVWEMTPGAMRDTEDDEVFVVLFGRAEIAFIDPPGVPIIVEGGSVVRLSAGMHTEWTVTQTLRKLYWAP